MELCGQGEIKIFVFMVRKGCRKMVLSFLKHGTLITMIVMIQNDRCGGNLQNLCHLRSVFLAVRIILDYFCNALKFAHEIT